VSDSAGGHAMARSGAAMRARPALAICAPIGVKVSAATAATKSRIAAYSGEAFGASAS
jgi:hypothetical protein